MKRVYTRVETAPMEAGLAVTLDGRAVKTPAGRPLVLANPALAEAVAAEWSAQDTEIRPETMPLTRLAATAIDLVAPQREQVCGEIAAYAATDLLCHRADAPAALVQRQGAAWQPLLDWLAQRYGARLEAVNGVVPRDQPADALAALGAAVAAYDDFALAGVHALTTACGSLALALGVAERRIDGETAWRLSQIDETFQSEQWGEDAEAVERRQRLRDDVLAAHRFLMLCRR